MSGLSEAVRALAVGDSLARPILVPINMAAKDALDAFRSNLSAQVTRLAPRIGREFTLTTLDDVTRDYKTAIRVVVVTRVS